MFDFHGAVAQTAAVAVNGYAPGYEVSGAHRQEERARPKGRRAMADHKLTLRI